MTAEWGWVAIPDAIKLATLMQAARFYERRQNVGGQLTRREVDEVSLGWSASTAHELDSDVVASIAAYRRLWLAV